jgi:hypothetical protein
MCNNHAIKTLFRKDLCSGWHRQKAGRMNGRGEFYWKNWTYLDELMPA